MNQLILLGNGFDLAHGLKTSYSDFILSYTKRSFSACWDKGIYEDELYRIDLNYTRFLPDIDSFTNIQQYEKFLIRDTYIGIHIGGIDDSLTNSQPFIWKIKHEFIYRLVSKCCELRWVDIENEFYSELKKVLDAPDEDEKNSSLKLLNEAMAFLKSKLQTYLQGLPKPESINDYFGIFSAPVRRADQTNPEFPDRTLVLNFNYTKTGTMYTDSMAFRLRGTVQTLNIHGELSGDANPMIFGFGDGLDDSYRKIETQTLRGFFTHIKSFGYFQTLNYQKLIDFLNLDSFEVYILGHSCGLSDRTMLNMIFEHRNRWKIKIFYYRYDGGNNYRELTEDISRHFVDKRVMREVISPFPIAVEMPQLR